MPAEATTPAAPVTAAAAPPPAPSGKPVVAFDVRMALAKSLGSPRVGDAAPAATTAAGGNIDADPDADPPADDGAQAGDPPGGDDAADAGDDAGDGDAAAPTGTPEERLEAVAKAFDSGDIEAMQKALEKAGMKDTGPVRRAFRAHQRRQRQLEAAAQKHTEKEREFQAARARAQQEIADENRRVEALLRHGREKYGWAAALEKAWEDEDMLAVGKAIEKACKGATLATITQKLATGKAGKTPEERELAEKQRKLDETIAAEAKKKTTAEEQKQQAQKREAAVARVGEALKAHPYLVTTNDAGEKVQDTEALAEVFAAYEASWNGEKFTKTAKACADELQAKLLARAKARGIVPAAAPAAAAKPAAGKTPKPAGKPTPRPGLKEPPRTSNPNRGTPADLEATRANRVAMARRATEMQRRGVR
jgi:hypothetical protein